MMITDNLGLYVHIPFCVSKCNYCDFASFSGVSNAVREKYVNRLCEEIKTYKRQNKLKVNSIFFGGGTPSLLEAEEFSVICDNILDTFDVDTYAEFTLETNPKTLTEEKLRVFKARGVNRLSIGVQSIHENELKKLGRIHGYQDFLKTLDIAHNVGITNINADLMYGIPDQTLASFTSTLDAVLGTGVTHISCYGLIIEENTPFYKNRDRLCLPDEDREVDMYYTAISSLARAGFAHYEISNYAASGYECRHNLKYWSGEEFIGVGLNAYSYFGKKRYGNSSSFEEYLADNYIEYRIEDTQDRDGEMFEYAMMRLRLSDGIKLSEYSHRYGIDFYLERREKIDFYINHGLMSLTDGRLFFTDRGFYVSNSILADIL